jgi:hypothetical protein
MKRVSLFEASGGLKDPARYRERLIRNVATSTAIETGESVQAISRDLRKFLEAGSPPVKPVRRR